MALKVGDRLPNFLAIDTVGNQFDSADLLGRKPLVIYFYPKDDTRVCTQQACSFRDYYQEFKEVGAEIIGISGDNLKSHLKFKTKYDLPFLLLSDEDKKIRNLFGVPTDFFGLIPGRVTYVIDGNGIIQLVIKSMKAAPHIDEALKTVKSF